MNSDGPVCLTSEWYEKINNGIDIREEFRDINMFSEKNVRTEAAIILILYSVYPLSLTADEIWRVMNKIPFLIMNDNEFNLYTTTTVLSKQN